MTDLMRLNLRATEIRARLSELAGADLTDEHRSELDTLRNEYRDNETKTGALIIAGDTPTETVTEDRQLSELRGKVNFGRYVAAALARRGADGAEREYNEERGIDADHFPLDILADAAGVEHRAKRDGDADANAGTWLDRVFMDTAAESIGVSFRNVAPGVAAYPVTTAGGSPGQRGREQAATESTYTVAVTEIKPARRAVHGIYSIEDAARLPGLADAIARDMAAAMVDSVDKAIFNGDPNADEAGADIVGLKTAAISETTITQTNKVKGDELLKAFLAYVDGQYAASMSDVRIAASVGSNVLWGGTVHAAAVSNQTVASFLRENGVQWVTRQGIDTATAAGDFGAYIGLGRGIEGAGIAAVWEAAQLITDPYTGAKSGEVQLTLNYLWQFGLPRTANYKRVKFVA